MTELQAKTQKKLMKMQKNNPQPPAKTLPPQMSPRKKVIDCLTIELKAHVSLSLKLETRQRRDSRAFGHSDGDFDQSASFLGVGRHLSEVRVLRGGRVDRPATGQNGSWGPTQEHRGVQWLCYRGGSQEILHPFADSHRPLRPLQQIADHPLIDSHQTPRGSLLHFGFPS